VGAFADRGNAYRLRERLKSTLGQTVRIDESDQSGYPVYRVQIGPLADVDTADRLHLHLADMGIASTQMIIESGVQ
jgi:rare lipoprotein A